MSSSRHPARGRFGVPLVITVACLAACRASTPATIEPPAQRWAADVHPLDRLDFETPDESLAALDGVIGDARFVGLGESMHTVGGFQRVKARIARYVIERLGFRAIALESNWEMGDTIADYVQRCEGAPETSVANGAFGVWVSPELIELVKWMCEWNRAHPQDPVTFFGFDVQQSDRDVLAVREGLGRLAPDASAALTAPLDRCHHPTGQPLVMERESHESCLGAIAAIRAWLDANEHDVVAASGADAPTDLRLRLTGIEAAEGQRWSSLRATGGEPDLPRSTEARDRGMASALLTLARLRAPGRRVLVWSHNTHVVHDNRRVVGAYGGGRTLGSFLGEALGEDYVAIALTGYRVSVNWPDVLTGPLDLPLHPASIEVRAHGLGLGSALIETRRSDVAEPFFVPGASYWMTSGTATDELVPAEQFDAVLYLDEAEAMTWASPY